MTVSSPGTARYNAAMPTAPTPDTPRSDATGADARPAVLSVGQLNRLARQLLEDAFPMVWVEGELSNLSRPGSGHWYFTLKDAQAQVRCAMFRGQNIRVRFIPEAGQRLLVKGKLSLYEGRGDYQLIVEQMQPAGAGDLAAAFEQLKRRLAAEGLFEPGRKRALPRLPRHIGVVTSPTGAAIRDILTVLARRFPAIPVTVLPVPVQGDGAAAQIAAAIERGNRLASGGQLDLDVLIVGRGGGSQEDLWAFNEEVVARAIAASALPVVSAVGHEVDVAISDFVADARAPTPSAAAELLSPDRAEWLETLEHRRRRLLQAWRQQQVSRRQQLEARRARLRHPGERLRQQAQRLDELQARLQRGWQAGARRRLHRLELLRERLQRHSPAQHLRTLAERLRPLHGRLQRALDTDLARRRQHLAASAQLLNSVSPLNTLGRGFAIVQDAQGRILRDAREVSTGDAVSARLARGHLQLRVEHSLPEQD